MKRFSPSEAAFEGFRVIRNHPGAILAWALAYVLIYMGIGLLALTMFGPQIATLSAASGQAVPPVQALGFVRSMGLGVLVFVPLSLLAAAIFINATFRPVLKPNDKGLFYLKISGDEGRLILLFLAYLGLGILTEIAFIVGLIILAVVFKSGLTAAHVTSLAPGLIGVACAIAIFCLAIWVVIRLSLAAPMTLATRKVSVFGSWRVTKGAFWSLLGCYFLAWIFAIMISILGWVISVSAGAVITGDWTPLSNALVNPRTAIMASGFGMLTHMFTLAAVVQLGISSVMSAVSRVIMYAPAAAAYRDLTAETEAPLQDAPIRSAGLML